MVEAEEGPRTMTRINRLAGTETKETPPKAPSQSSVTCMRPMDIHREMGGVKLGHRIKYQLTIPHTSSRIDAKSIDLVSQSKTG